MLTRHVALGGLALALLVTATAARAATDVQSCTAAIERASGKLVDCRLKVESVFARTGDAAKRAGGLAKCGAVFSSSFDKALLKYGYGDCPSTPESAFDAHLTTCADVVVTAAGGGALPVCGDGIVNVGGEACDGADLGGATCASLGFVGGTLGCSASCGFDTGACDRRSVVPTGQTTCWNTAGALVPCPGTGHDGDAQAGAPRGFTDNGDGTITDRITGLTWEKKSDDGSIHDMHTTYPWADAIAIHVAGLNAIAFGGHTDWRLPNLNELESLRDLGAFVPGESISSVPAAFRTNCPDAGGNPGCTVLECSCTNPVPTWTSSSSQFLSAEAWYVQFYVGEIGWFQKTHAMAVRAVRGGL